MCAQATRVGADLGTDIDGCVAFINEQELPVKHSTPAKGGERMSSDP